MGKRSDERHQAEEFIEEVRFYELTIILRS